MKELKTACKETYDKLWELDQLIRPYAVSRHKAGYEIDLIEETIEALSVARGGILLLSGGLEGDEWLYEEEK